MNNQESSEVGKGDLLRIGKGDVVRFQIQRGSILAGMKGVYRINSFEKSKRGNVVYIDRQQDDGSYFERFARYWPFKIAFAPLTSSKFKVYEG